MSKHELKGIIDRYYDHVELQHTVSQVIGLGYLIVPRPGSPIENSIVETVNEVGDNAKLVGQLGLPPNSGLILATTELPEAALAAVFGGGEHDPLAPTKDDIYGWDKYSYNEDGSAPWVDQSQRKRRVSRSAGRLLFVPMGDFRERSDQPGHYFRAANEGLLESVDSIVLFGPEINHLAADDLVRWVDLEAVRQSS